MSCHHVTQKNGLLTPKVGETVETSLWMQMGRQILTRLPEFWNRRGIHYLTISIVLLKKQDWLCSYYSFKTWYVKMLLN